MGFSDIFVRVTLHKTRKSCIGRWLYSGSWVTLRAVCWNEWSYLHSEELFRNLCWRITLHPQVNFKRTHAVSKSQQELPATPSQLRSYPSQLPSRSVQCSHQDSTFYFVSQHVATLQGEALHAKNSQELSSSHCLLQSQETGEQQGSPSRALVATYLSLSREVKEQTGSWGNVEPDFEFPFFFRVCHFPNASLWKETDSWSHIRSIIVQEDCCGATYWGQAPKRAAGRNDMGLLTSYMGQMLKWELEKETVTLRECVSLS